MRRSPVLYALLTCACGQANPAPGYALSPDTRNDLSAMWTEIANSPSCLNEVPATRVVCEYFAYVPCDTSSRVATPVSAVPPSCEQSTRLQSGRTDPIGWCLIGPHVEPQSDDGCDSAMYFVESAYDAMDCGSALQRRDDLMNLVASGGLDFEASCYAVSPVDVLDACIHHFCP